LRSPVLENEEYDVLDLGIVAWFEMDGSEQIVDCAVHVGPDELTHPEFPIVRDGADSSQLRCNLYWELVRPVAGSSREIHVVESAASAPAGHEVARHVET